MAYNINTRCLFDASSTLGTYSTNFLNDGSRGLQSDFNYWNSTKFAFGQQIIVNLRNISAVKNIILQAPIFNISGPYILFGIQVDLFLNNVNVFSQNNLSLTGGVNLADCVDINLNFAPINSDKLIITFENPNIDGYVFLGEVIINCVDNTFLDAAKYLQNKSNELIRASVQYMNSGIRAFPPQAGVGYDAFWLRDYAYMLEGSGVDSFYPNELLDNAYLFTKKIRSDGAQVDTVRYSGEPIYQPGFGTMGTNPVLDGACFYIDIIYQTYLLTGSFSLLQNTIGACLYAHNFIPLGPNNIPYISPIGWDRAPYGFTDSVRKQGEQLFDGLLLIQARRQLVTILTLLNRLQEARLMYVSLISLIQKINTVFWDDNIGLYRACTGQCSINFDIWGSAFAVRLNVPSEAMILKIANYFNNNYDNLIQNGHLRHLTFPEYWEVSTAAQGTYQNGGFWPCAVGWFIYVLDLVNPSKADETIIKMVQYMQQNQVYEWINGGLNAVPNYRASTSLPLESIRALIKRRTGGSVINIPSAII